jgi:hypothetical protein
VKKSLSLDERVVGREREKQQLRESKPASDISSSSSSSQLELISPSTILQSMSGSRNGVVVERGRSSPSVKKEDYSALSGLAALSTAAFLQLDEDKKWDLRKWKNRIGRTTHTKKRSWTATSSFTNKLKGEQIDLIWALGKQK